MCLNERQCYLNICVAAGVHSCITTYCSVGEQNLEMKDPSQMTFHFQYCFRYFIWGKCVFIFQLISYYCFFTDLFFPVLSVCIAFLLNRNTSITSLILPKKWTFSSRCSENFEFSLYLKESRCSLYLFSKRSPVWPVLGFFYDLLCCSDALGGL